MPVLQSHCACLLCWFTQQPVLFGVLHPLCGTVDKLGPQGCCEWWRCMKSLLTLTWTLLAGMQNCWFMNSVRTKQHLLIYSSESAVQGIYLCEHRDRASGRRLVVTLQGE